MHYTSTCMHEFCDFKVSYRAAATAGSKPWHSLGDDRLRDQHERAYLDALVRSTTYLLVLLYHVGGVASFPRMQKPNFLHYGLPIHGGLQIRRKLGKIKISSLLPDRFAFSYETEFQSKVQ
jgi:hypothetical protein